MSKKILIIIPARSGSTRVKNKNLKKLGKKPLLYYKIKQCLKIKSAEVFVSTNSDKIAKFAKNCGAKVPFLREKKYATSKASTTSVVLEVLRQMKIRDIKIPNYIGVLPPTNPFLKSESIELALKKITKAKKINSILSITGIKDHPFNVVEVNKKLKFDTLKIKNKKYSQFERTQDWPRVFISSAALKISKKIFFLKMIKNKSPLLKSKAFDLKSCIGYQVTRLESFDINQKQDFEIASFYIKKFF